MILKNHNLAGLFWGICFWVLLFSTSTSSGQNSSLSFNHYDVTNGLSNNSILSITQDSTGFIWLGTKYGLNRYDGRTFKVFKNDPENKNSISSNYFITGLALASNKKMWVVSSALDLYQSEDNSFENIIPKSAGIKKVLQDSKGNLWIGGSHQLKFIAPNSKKIFPLKIEKSDIQVSEIFEDNEHHIWVGSSTGLYELFFLNKKLIKKRHFGYELNGNENIGPITSIVQDKSSKFWIGTKKNGLYSFDKKSLQLTNFVKNSSNGKNSLVNNNVRKILLHKDGSLWIGTQDGLSILNPITHQFTNYQHDPSNPKSLSQNSIYDIFQDKNGSVWIGTYFGGVNIVYSVNTPFTIYQNSIAKNSISSNIISSVVEDSHHNLWIGTEAGGLNYFNKKNQVFSFYKNSNTNKNSLSSNLVKGIAIDKDQNVWIATSLGGLNLLDPKTSTFTVYKPNSKNNNSISTDDISCMIISKENKLFIGSYFGINIYDIAQQKFSLIANSELPVNVIFEDKQGTIWIGASDGIRIYQTPKLIYKNFKDNSDKSFNFNVNCFFQDRIGNIWVGTVQNGLALLNPKNNTFKTFDTKDGLPTNNILSITEDNETNLWISTDNGLVKYNRHLNTFRTFNILDGLPDNLFNINSVLKDSQGRLYFGTYNGLVSFMSKSIEKNTLAPEVVFSNLKLFNIPVAINDESGLLKQDINNSETLTFNHDQNIFTIEFSALNFIKSNKNKYAYKLDGLEKNWNYVDIPSATYNNLPAGSYQFLVKGSNNDGIWSKDIKKINIVILPPMWETWWAYLIYFAIIAAIGYQINAFLKARRELKQELHFEKMKLDFFTNVSHEIRTPLTLILGPIEKLEQLTTENTQANKYALSIKNNTERLYRLVNELLDFRKADSGNLRPYFSEENIVSVLKEVFENFQALAEAKNIQYTFKSSHPEILVYFDKDQMEKVFFNLLSNAFKFTQDGGTINLKITLKKQNVKIKVIDNGKGIDIKNIDDIFKNFYQAGQNFGTGIGLALSKSLVELHKGKINVTSTPATENKTGKTTFTVSLQLGKNHLNDNDITPMPSIENHIYQEVNEYSAQDFIENPAKEEKNKKAHILVVEDNDEVREFIKQSLEDLYYVHESKNGLEGWKNAIQSLPDLIISDVMMPIMDGLELCKKLKTDIRTSHIPVIMLTAKSDPLHQIEGLQHGADIYITKPFREQILQLNIHNLLSLRAALQKKYSEQLSQLPVLPDTESTQDEKLLHKLRQIIEANISNIDLDTNFITSEIGMSRSVLYKKFSALTNQPLKEFITSIRLKQSVEIFLSGETSVQSVALEVGFNDVKIFRREFKRVYGITPGEYVKNKGKTEA
ncbi:hybrid sensor histidine kinase/response regulator transcription factor [Flavobacterium aquiphilum]|uniref:hybrid sensor histidine kinase/response regulator transcription factor n=1 Tax=Flavobacterium aquiphilum TaxID=3003261 RepID=UPI00248073A3|nr:hybrid sensor histidine kinase/response regulator transcription factor [Flavobacterium aquiphilum]